MKKPNFFIVGAPKCGTTALYEYLKSHPQVFLSKPKEPHYFADDFGDRFRICTDEETYLTKFFAGANTHNAVGEASAAYLYSRNAIPNIKKFNPGARLIIMVRNPADMAYSAHSLLVYSFYEDEKDFAKAWALQDERKAGRKIPKKCVVPVFLQYKDLISVGAQLQRAYTHFPREQVKVIFFDDLKSNPAAVYSETLRFLGLPLDNRSDFSVVNANKRHRIEWVSRSFNYIPHPVIQLVRKVKKMVGLEKLGIVEMVNKLNQVHTSRSPLPESVRQNIIASVHRDIDLLENLTGRDLSSWKTHDEAMSLHRKEAKGASSSMP